MFHSFLATCATRVKTLETVFITLSKRLINVIVSQDSLACSVTELVSYLF